MKKVNEAAALHFAEGALKAGEVPVGEHDLSRVQIVLTLPDGAKVTRDEGSEGDGSEALGAAETVTLPAALLFIQRSGLVGPSTFGLWKSCILDAVNIKEKPKDLMPPEAKAALAQIESELPADCKRRKKTAAQRFGVAATQIQITRLTKQHAAALATA